MNNYTKKTMVTLLAATTWGAVAFAASSEDLTEKDTTNEQIDLGTFEGSDTVTRNYTGTGTVKIEYTGTGHSGTVNLGTSFAGTLEYTGNMNAWNTNVVIGSDATLKLASRPTVLESGSYSELYGMSNRPIAYSVEFTTNFGIRSGYSKTFTGSVSSAAGTTLYFYNDSRSSTDTVTFNGTTDLGNVELSNGGNVVFNNATTSVESLTLKEGSMVTVGTGVTLSNTTIEIVLDSTSVSDYLTTAALLGAGSLGENVTVTITSTDDALVNAIVSGTSYQIFGSDLNLGSANVELGGKLSGFTVNESGALTIPEPSAFGLLAGLGALALVASRRRRRG